MENILKKHDLIEKFKRLSVDELFELEASILKIIRRKVKAAEQQEDWEQILLDIPVWDHVPENKGFSWKIEEF